MYKHKAVVHQPSLLPETEALPERGISSLLSQEDSDEWHVRLQL